MLAYVAASPFITISFLNSKLNIFNTALFNMQLR